MKCELCGDPSASKSVCGCCRTRMNNGEHPAICLTCRERLGVAYSVEWVRREILDKEAQSIFAALAKDVGGVAAIIRVDCPDCRKETMPCLTGSSVTTASC